MFPSSLQLITCFPSARNVTDLTSWPLISIGFTCFCRLLLEEGWFPRGINRSCIFLGIAPPRSFHVLTNFGVGVFGMHTCLSRCWSGGKNDVDDPNSRFLRQCPASTCLFDHGRHLRQVYFMTRFRTRQYLSVLSHNVLVTQVSQLHPLVTSTTIRTRPRFVQNAKDVSRGQRV